MTAGKTYPYLAIVVIVCLILATIVMMYPKNGRVEKSYGAHYFPNRMVIRVDGVTSDHTREALAEIKKKYNIEEIIDRSPIGFTYTKIIIIAVPKDPNSPL